MPAKKASKSRSHSSRAASAPPATAAQSTSSSGPSSRNREEQRWHRTLERQFHLAQQRASSADTRLLPTNLGSTPASQPPLEGALQPAPGHPISPSESGVPQQAPAPATHRPSGRIAPAATYTPTAAGLRWEEGPRPDPPVDVQSIVVATLSNLLASGTWSPAVAPMTQLPPQPSVGSISRHYLDYDCYQDSIHSEDSNWEDEDHRDSEFSEDEGLPPDRPPLTRLFRPALFQSLLHKAKVSTNLADPSVQQAPSSSSLPPEGLFNVQPAAQDFIPCPQLFSEVIQRPWGLLASSRAPNGLDWKLYCSAPNLQDLLQLPSVDAPVAQLTASSVLTGDVADGLRIGELRSFYERTIRLPLEPSGRRRPCRSSTAPPSSGFASCRIIFHLTTSAFTRTLTSWWQPRNTPPLLLWTRPN